MSSSERTNFQEAQNINSEFQIARGNYRRLCIRGIASSLIYIGFHEVTENSDYSVLNTYFNIVLLSITALSASGAIGISYEIQKTNDSKAQEQRFYRSLSRHNSDLNHHS